MTLHKEYDPFDDFPTAGPMVAPVAPDGSHDTIAAGEPAPQVIQDRVVAEETQVLYEDAPTTPIDTNAVRTLGEQLDAEAAAKAEAGETDADAPVTLATIAVATTAEKPADEKEATDEETTAEVADEANTEATAEVVAEEEVTEADEAKKEADKPDDDSVELTEAVMKADVVKSRKGLRNKLIGAGLVVLAGLGYRMATAGSDSTPEETRSSGPAATAEAFPSSSASPEMSVDLNTNSAVVAAPTQETTTEPTVATEAPTVTTAPAGEVDGEVIVSPDLQKYFVNYAALGSNPEAYLETYASRLITPEPITQAEFQHYFEQSVLTLGFDSSATTAEQWVQGFVDEKLKENYSAVFNALYVNRNLKPAQQQLMAEAMLKNILQTSDNEAVADFAKIIQSAVANAPEGGHYEASFGVGTNSANGDATFMPVNVSMDFYDAQGKYVSSIDNPASPSTALSTEFKLVMTSNGTVALSAVDKIKAVN